MAYTNTIHLLLETMAYTIHLLLETKLFQKVFLTKLLFFKILMNIIEQVE